MCIYQFIYRFIVDDLLIYEYQNKYILLVHDFNNNNFPNKEELKEVSGIAFLKETKLKNNFHLNTS